jgi:hypothetical protein
MSCTSESFGVGAVVENEPRLLPFWDWALRRGSVGAVSDVCSFTNKDILVPCPHGPFCVIRTLFMCFGLVLELRNERQALRAKVLVR